VKAKLRLSERTFRCDQCGLVLDRDLRRRPQPRRTRGRGRRWHVPPSCGATRNEARGKPTQDPHLAGSGYRHGKTHTNRCGPTSTRQRAHSEHAFTRFLNGWPGEHIARRLPLRSDTDFAKQGCEAHCD
jgi:hypothetical protein